MFEFIFQARRLPDVDSPAKNAELVFMEDSPDPCRSTRINNRVCNWRNETSSEGDCGLLCCGRGFKVGTLLELFYNASNSGNGCRRNE